MRRLYALATATAEGVPAGHRKSPAPLKPRDRADNVETQVVEWQRLATSLLVRVMLVCHARPVPFPKSAPVQRAGFTGHTDNIECPG